MKNTRLPARSRKRRPSRLKKKPVKRPDAKNTKLDKPAPPEDPKLADYSINLKTSPRPGEATPVATTLPLDLLSPAPHENIREVRAGANNNDNLALYSDAIRDAAKQHRVAFIDIFRETESTFRGRTKLLTIDGSALNERGHRVFANAAHKTLFHEPAPEIDENLRALAIDKAAQFFHRYRPLNTFYYTGGRNKSYGYLDFLPTMRNFDLMVANRDQAIWKTAAGTPTKPDDSNLPKLDDVLLARGANEWLSPADELKAFKIDPRFEVNCFASEEDFPELACPIQMRWDARGRLWVSCSTTYPHVYPGQAPNDKIVILEDTNADGKADTRESIFHNSQVETSCGPVRAKNSSWFLYNPAHRRLTAFGAYNNTNPWGVTFHATNPPYPTQHPRANGMQAYSGPRGAAYVCDWYNPVKGHAQYSLRDPRRDRKSGRIWRIVPRGAKLQDPPKIAGASIPELLDHLKSPHYRVRYWAKRELRGRRSYEVSDGLKTFVQSLNATNPDHVRHLLEALWLSQGIDAPNPDLLTTLAASDNHLAAAAAASYVGTKDTLTVNAGRPVKLILTNPDATQHNIAILQPGTPLEEIGAAANEMAKSIEGFNKHFIPDDKRILHATKLVDPESVAVLRFIAPKKPGIYPYLCTFPGHWILMKGQLIVK